MEDVDSLRRIASAFDLAARAHEGQKRGQGRREPFVSHVADVARRVSESPHADATTLIAALLHDVVEKTDHSLAEIETEFGIEIADLVRELTDDDSLSKVERRRRQVESAPRLSDRAKRVKLADKSSKLASIAAAPPPRWRKAHAREEVVQARRVAAGLRGIDPTLEAAFDREADRAVAALGT